LASHLVLENAVCVKVPRSDMRPNEKRVWCRQRAKFQFRRNRSKNGQARMFLVAASLNEIDNRDGVPPEGEIRRWWSML